MPLLQSYTVSFVDKFCKKVCIDFVDTNPSIYELNSIVKFFKKHKRETFVERKGDEIVFIVCRWDLWIEFLYKMRFIDTAKAVSYILKDLERDKITIDEYFDLLKQSKTINPLDEKSTIVEEIPLREWEQRKLLEIERITPVKDEGEEDELQSVEAGT